MDRSDLDSLRNLMCFIKFTNFHDFTVYFTYKSKNINFYKKKFNLKLIALLNFRLLFESRCKLFLKRIYMYFIFHFIVKFSYFLWFILSLRLSIVSVCWTVEWCAQEKIISRIFFKAKNNSWSFCTVQCPVLFFFLRVSL